MTTYRLPFTGDTIKSELQQLVNNEFTNVMSQTSSPAPLADNDEIPTTGWVQDEISSRGVAKIASIERRLDALYELTQGQVWDFDVDTNNAYSVEVPSGAKLATVQKYGGKSLVFNQLNNNNTASVTRSGVTFTNNNDGSWTINGTNDGTDTSYTNVRWVNNTYFLVEGHKYYLSAASSLGNNLALILYRGSVGVGSFALSEQIVTTPAQSGNYDILRLRLSTTYTSAISNVKVYPMLIDLTQMFGAGNEPTTVAEVKALLPNNYYAYNTGEVIHADVDKVDVFGKNKFDGVGREGYYDATTGVFVSAVGSGTFANTNKIYVSPNTTYYFKCPSDKYIVVFEYNANGSFVRRNAPSTTGSNVVTTTSTTAYINFHIGSYGTTYNNDILVCKGSSGTFIPYSKQTYPIPQAIRNLDGYGWSVGNVYNEVDFERKKFIKRVGGVDLGSLTWTKSTAYTNLFYSTISGCKTDTSLGTGLHALCGKYENYIGSFSNMPDKSNRCGGRYISSTINGEILIKDSDYSSSTASAFKTAMNGVYLYYELATPVETDITDILEPFNVEDGGTITFHNSNGDGYGIPVPSTEEYAVKLSEVVSNG